MKHLVVSIHDVSPLTRDAAEQILQRLRALGVGETSLLVVPDHHHRAPFLRDGAFCSWLSEQHGNGHEIVLHGYFHERARRTDESPLAKIITRFYTADEGEFFDLDEPTAFALVKQAMSEFAQLHFFPAGFIAPAWLLSHDAEKALRQLQFEYTTRLSSVSDLKTGAVQRSQSLVWSVRNAWRRAVSLCWNAFLFERLRANPLLRVSIHPPDFAHAEIRRQIERLVSRALAERKAMTYQHWVAGARRPRDSP